MRIFLFIIAAVAVAWVAQGFYGFWAALAVVAGFALGLWAEE